MFLMIEVTVQLAHYRILTFELLPWMPMPCTTYSSHTRVLAYVSHEEADRLWSGRRHADARGSGSEDDVLAIDPKMKFFRLMSSVRIHCCFATLPFAFLSYLGLQ